MRTASGDSVTTEVSLTRYDNLDAFCKKALTKCGTFHPEKLQFSPKTSWFHPLKNNFPFFLKLLLSTYSLLPAHLTKSSVKFCPLYKQCLQFSLFSGLKPFVHCSNKILWLNWFCQIWAPLNTVWYFLAALSALYRRDQPDHPDQPDHSDHIDHPDQKECSKLWCQGSFTIMPMYPFSQAWNLLPSVTKSKRKLFSLFAETFCSVRAALTKCFQLHGCSSGFSQAVNSAPGSQKLDQRWLYRHRYKLTLGKARNRSFEVVFYD